MDFVSGDVIVNFDANNAMGKAMAPVNRAWERAGDMMMGICFNRARTISVVSGGKVYVAWRTGELAYSIGGTISDYGKSSYTRVQTMGGESLSPGGIPGANKNGVQYAIVTSSGYGFWVHQGTSKTPGRPFVTEPFAEEGYNLFIGMTILEVKADGG